MQPRNYGKRLPWPPPTQPTSASSPRSSCATGHNDEAIDHYQIALGIAADDVEAQCGLGAALLAKGKPDEAIDVFRKLLAARPKDTGVLNYLAIALCKQGKTAEAIETWEELVRIDPEDAGARHNLGGMLFAAGRIKEAVAQGREELRLNPGNERLMNDLAWVMATSSDASLRNGKEAVQLAQQAVKRSGGKSPAILDTLAAAHAEAGQFPEAERTARDALQQAIEQGNRSLAESLRKRLKFYGEGKPWRDAPPPPAKNR